MERVRQQLDAVWRIEGPHVVGSLTRFTGDFSLAEDVAQEALAEALAAWPRTGVPDRPAAWLMTTARRRAVDAFRRRAGQDERYAALAHDPAGSPLVAHDAGATEDWDPDRVEDDVLALMFIACHPVLAPEARVALTLRVVGGMSSEEIARAFLVPTPTVQARITRAKRTLAATRVPFEVPPPEERAVRLGSVLSVLSVIFTEGAHATRGESAIRFDLASEARRLARVVTRMAPVPEAYGLLALMELTSARFPARLSPDGEPVLLADQDRRLWDRSAIRRGLAALDVAGRVGRGLGAYGVQAAIAACHARAPSVEETDWEQVVVLYEALGRLTPSPVVELNRAVAVAMAHGPAEALRIVDGLADDPRMARYHLLPATRAELLARSGRTVEALEAYDRAIALCESVTDRALLRRKQAELGG